MKEEIANLVHPVFSYGLRLKDRLARGEAANLDMYNEQQQLKGLLLSELEAKRLADYGGDRGSDASMMGGHTGTVTGSRRTADSFLGIRYALVCWLDEIFIADSPWSQEWNERKLEFALYGSNDRAWTFWDQARKAEARPGGDALEVFFLCVVLGFRGELREQPDRLQAWMSATQTRIAKAQPQEMPAPPDLEPASHVPPRRWRDRLNRMVLIAAILVLCTIPIMAYLLINALTG